MPTLDAEPAVRRRFASVLDYLDCVATPDSTYSLRPLWFWNARLDEDDVRQQRGQMNAKGVRGDIYTLVHCAVVLRRRSDSRDITEADWDLQADTNLKATFFPCRTVAECMGARRPVAASSPSHGRARGPVASAARSSMPRPEAESCP